MRGGRVRLNKPHKTSERHDLLGGIALIKIILVIRLDLI